MYISLNWIKDFVDLEGVDVEYLVNKFTMSCAEVEGFEYKGKDISGVVTAKIIDVKPVENSKKLHLLQVDKGDEVVQIVCGAPNVRVGLVTALATIGAKLGDITIGKAKLAGIESFGMCCGGDEIGISDDHSGIVELDENTPIGKDIKEVLDIEDVIIEIDNKSLTNRPDLWGHYGIAREIAAIVGKELKPLPIEIEDNFANKTKTDIVVDTPSCYRYTSANMENITKTKSDLNTQIRLFYCGMRGINLLADITNYVMLELGQPMHAFDNSIVKNIKVKNLEKAENFKTLDDTDRELPANTMVITSDNKPVAVAGVMGGQNSEINDNTTSVLIESACFDGAVVRKTAAALKLRTESSARYEKMLDPELTKTALLRYVYLVKQNDMGAKISSAITDVYNYHYPKINIKIEKDYIDNYVGVEISQERIIDILTKLQFNIISDKNGVYEIEVPSFRATKDISGKADIIEEIARVFGYDNIPPKTLKQPLIPSLLNKDVKLEYDVKYNLANRYNLNEVHSYLWYDLEMNKILNIEPTSVIRCVNSINKDNDKLRSTIIPSLLKVVYDNKNTQNEIGVFEIGRVVKSLNNDTGLVNETKSLGVVLYKKSGEQTELIVELKNILDYLFNYIIKADYELELAKNNEEYYHPVNFYNIKANNKVIGNINLLHPVTLNNLEKNSAVAVMEINFTEVIELTTNSVKFAPIAKFPTTKLDFNFLIPKNMLYKDIISYANNIETELCYNVSLLDIYEKDDEELKSYTLHYEVNSMERNLTTQDIEKFHTAVIEKFKQNNIELKI